MNAIEEAALFEVLKRHVLNFSMPRAEIVVRVAGELSDEAARIIRDLQTLERIRELANK